MAGFFQKRPYREAPSQLPDLADHLPLVKRLTASWCMANGTAHDLGPYARHGVKSQHVSMLTTLHGRTAFHNATQEATPIDIGTIEAGHPLTFSGTDQHSSFFLMKQVGTGNNYSRVYEKASSGFAANGYGLAVDADGSLDWYQSGALLADTHTSIISLNTWYAVGISVDGPGSNTNIYVNGIDVTKVSSAVTFSTSQTNMSLLGWNHSASRVFNGYVPFIHMWDYPLSAAEHLRLARNPFMLYERRVWVPVGAAAVPTGTGTIALGISTLSAQAVMEPDGSGALILDETLLSAAGLQEIPGTSALSLSDAILSASGTHGTSSTATVSLSEVLVDAQGTQEYIATAAPLLSTTVLDANGNAAVAPDGTGTLILDSTLLAGTGVQSIPGAGTVLLETIVLDADGFSGAPEGTGTLILDQAALDSQAVMLPDGSAVIVLDLTVISSQGLGPAPEGGPWIIYARRRGRR